MQKAQIEPTIKTLALEENILYYIESYPLIL